MSHLMSISLTNSGPSSTQPKLPVHTLTTSEARFCSRRVCVGKECGSAPSPLRVVASVLLGGMVINIPPPER